MTSLDRLHVVDDAARDIAGVNTVLVAHGLVPVRPSPCMIISHHTFNTLIRAALGLPATMERPPVFARFDDRVGYDIPGQRLKAHLEALTAPPGGLR